MFENGLQGHYLGTERPGGRGESNEIRPYFAELPKGFEPSSGDRACGCIGWLLVFRRGRPFNALRARFSDQAEPIEQYLGPQVMPWLDRIFARPDGAARLKLLGYNTVAASGRMDTATQNAIAAYARKRRIQKSLETVQAAMCQELRQRCVNHSGSPR